MPATGSERPAAVARPRRTLRLRLTLLYGGLFVVAGAVLLAITYGLVASSVSAHATKQIFIGRVSPGAKHSAPVLPVPPNFVGAGNVVVSAPPGANRPVVQLRAYAGQVNATFKRLTAAQAARLSAVESGASRQILDQRSAQLDALLTRSGIALAIMAIVSIGLGWLMAGRALRPVRTMSARARGISERNLHERLGLEGPDDELKELGDTFDGLLARLEAAFESQRLFVANASHELRTPITLERTLVEVALADPSASVGSLRETCQRVLAASEHQERLIEALLTLARSQRGLDARAPLDLGAIAGDVVAGIPSNAVGVEFDLGEAVTTGDPALVERLVANLLDNALRYNQPGGWVSAWTGIRGGSPTLEIANSGPVIDPRAVDALAQPFRRLNGARGSPASASGPRGGLGLGLSIVCAIAEAHGARFDAAARRTGGLRIEVRFEPEPSTPANASTSSGALASPAPAGLLTPS